MFGFIGTVCVLAVFIWFCKNYLQPYEPPKPVDNTKDSVVDLSDFDYDREQLESFDDILKEIYGRD